MTTTAARHRGADVASTADIRRRFPALERRARRPPGRVLRRARRHAGARGRSPTAMATISHHNANTHWRYPTSEETDALIAGAREALADFLGAAPRGDRRSAPT